MLAIRITKKTFGSRAVLEEVFFTVPEKGLYGFVGKNGEGKTTLFKCIAQIFKFEGSILKDGLPIKSTELAFVPTEAPLYDELTAAEFSDFYNQLLGLKGKSIQPLFEVPQDKLIKEFSTGMKKKTYINAVLQKKYAVYILDEPFNGLDLESNYLLMNHIRDLAQESIVLISSHILELLYKNCDTIFVLKNKKIKPFEKAQFSEIESVLFVQS